MFDLSIEKVLIIGVVALLLVGPERLPAYAAQLGRWVRVLRGMADTAKERMKEEMGPEFDDFEWKRLDPRQYDPRRIVREALLDGPAPVASRMAAVAVPVRASGGSKYDAVDAVYGVGAHVDPEAT